MNRIEGNRTRRSEPVNLVKLLGVLTALIVLSSCLCKKSSVTNPSPLCRLVESTYFEGPKIYGDTVVYRDGSYISRQTNVWQKELSAHIYSGQLDRNLLSVLRKSAKEGPRWEQLEGVPVLYWNPEDTLSDPVPGIEELSEVLADASNKAHQLNH